jgi:glycosyltransferase involved in cell wall biosynthesis
MYACKTLVCSYNGEQYIAEQVLSIECSFKSAGVQNHLIAVFDDGSIDKTNQVIIALKNQLSDGKLSYQTDANKGVVSNFINAILSAETPELDWLFLADQDDVWHEDKVSEYFNVFQNIPVESATIVFSDAALIDEEGTVFSTSFFHYQGLSTDVLRDDSILFKNCVQGATIALNKPMITLLRDSLNYIDITQMVMHDWWLAILAKYYGQYVFINKPLIKYRQHNQNQIGAQSNNRLMAFIKSPNQYYASYVRILNQARVFISMDAVIKPERNLHQAKQFSIQYCGFLKRFLVFFCKSTLFKKKL